MRAAFIMQRRAQARSSLVIVTSPFEVGRTAATAMTFGKGGGIIDVAEE